MQARGRRMISKSAHFLAFAMGWAVLFPPSSFTVAKADPVETLRCNSAHCEFGDELEASTRREYRAVCTGRTKPYPKNISIKQENKSTSCNAKCWGPGNSNYISKSCTNASEQSRDKLRIVVRCGGNPHDLDDTGDVCG
jgi:hypothetical protein